MINRLNIHYESCQLMNKYFR